MSALQPGAPPRARRVFVAFLLLLQPARPQKCVMWRQTGGCDPNGPRESDADRHCHEVVHAGNSGYCECADGQRVMKSTCDHGPFTCDDSCARSTASGGDREPPCATRHADGTCVNPAAATRQQSAATPAATQSAATPAATPAVSQSYRCLGWRQTHGCDPNGRRERGSYEGGCDTNIDAGRSGFCECQGLTDGKPHRVRLSSCDHMPFTCTTECARASFYTCDGWRQTGGCQPDGKPRQS